jgi:hypothetical protein
VKIFILPDVKQKLDLYVDAVTGEISGLGKAVVREHKIYIEDVYLFKQVSGGSETELDQEALALFMNEIMVRGDRMEEVKLWWH